MRVKEVIKEHGYTLESVGTALGKSKSGMSQIANNDNTPPSTLRKIAEVIGCDITEFFLDEVSKGNGGASALVCPHCGKPIEVHLKTGE